MGLLEVIKLVLVGSSKVSNHAAVMAGNNNTAFSGGLDIVDTILSVDTGLLAGFCEDVGVLVFTDAANEGDGVLGEDVLLRIRLV